METQECPCCSWSGNISQMDYLIIDNTLRCPECGEVIIENWFEPEEEETTRG